MATLTVEEKATIQNNPIGQWLDSAKKEFLARFASLGTPTSSAFFADIINSAASKDVFEYFLDLMTFTGGLAAARKLPSHVSPQGTLRMDISDLSTRFGDMEQLDKRLVAGALEAIICHKSGDDEFVWVAIYDLVSCPIAPESRIISSSPLLATDNTLDDIRGDWTRKYFPESLELLQSLVLDCKMEEYYSKTLVFLQSSGAGKSRLADAFGETCLMISFNLRREGTIGYPPADTEIRDFLQRQPAGNYSAILRQSPQKDRNSEYPINREHYIWDHSIVVSLLRASFEYLGEWVREQGGMSLKDLAKARHYIMAPIETESWSARSPKRVEYCRSVVQKAEIYLGGLVQSQTWRKIFNKDKKSDIRRKLLESTHLDGLKHAVQTLLQNLPEPQGPRMPSWVTVFDEASTLLFYGDSDKPNPGLYVALNRIFSCLRDYNLWFFVLSTESQIEKLLPPEQITEDNRDGSAREALGTNSKAPLKIFPPFVALQLDVEDRRLMMFKSTREKELSKAMAKFSTLEHMRLFGRPLWFAYKDMDKMVQVAAKKLIGGKEGPYDSKNVDQVFAVLSFRISLDLCLENPRALALAGTAVNYHMRILMAVHQDIEALDTFTPSEPVLSEAAIRYLCQPKMVDSRRKVGSEESEKYEGNVHKTRWSGSIRTLTQKLLQDGLIHKGTKGELFSRLILILARDCVHLDAGLQLKPTSPFTVREFLIALYPDKYHESISAIEPRVLNALMNFTHFTSTDENLHLHSTAELCHDLLRRSAALQLALNQPSYDHLIPIYFGSADEIFTPSKCGVIVVQVKNKNKSTTVPPHIFNEGFDIVTPGTELPGAGSCSVPRTRDGKRKQRKRKSKSAGPPFHKPKYFSLGGTNPILLLLFDLGISKPDFRVQVSRSRKNSAADPYIWAIHSKGHRESTFRCIETIGCTEACALFFASAVPQSSRHDELARRNQIFYRLDREFRYKTQQEEGQVSDQDGDVAMVDV
ncbi:MAG: hypothetical protein M1840_002414 [Geoglossum simile]|nr:MAG: hypothetical protein M1840_002414 [Geoglossum simile]